LKFIYSSSLDYLFKDEMLWDKHVNGVTEIKQYCQTLIMEQCMKIPSEHLECKI
jgi:hypothetical protein